MPLVKNRRCEFIRTVGGIGSNEFDPTVRHEQLNLTALDIYPRPSGFHVAYLITVSTPNRYR
jgi:hypothetical protein